MASRYWDYWNDSTSTTTGGYDYTRHFYDTSASSSTTSGYWHPTSTADTTSTWTTRIVYPVYRFEEYLLSGFDYWSDAARAAFTRLINDETQTGFKIKMWIKGDVDVTDMGIQLRDLDWFMLRLRQVASRDDYEKIAAFVKEAQAEAQGIEAGTDETAQQAQPEGQEPGPKDAP